MKIRNSIIYLGTFFSIAALGGYLDNFYVGVLSIPACFVVAIILHKMEK